MTKVYDSTGKSYIRPVFRHPKATRVVCDFSRNSNANILQTFHSIDRVCLETTYGRSLLLHILQLEILRQVESIGQEVLRNPSIAFATSFGHTRATLRCHSRNPSNPSSPSNSSKTPEPRRHRFPAHPLEPTPAVARDGLSQTPARSCDSVSSFSLARHAHWSRMRVEQY